MARIQVPKKGTFTCDSSTAEEAVEYLRQVLDEPAHGNVLLSCGPQKLDPTQQLRECNAEFVFANYSWLSSGPPVHIAATELRGITIEQLSSLLDFIVDIASSWCDAHHLAYGQPLSFEAFNLYHADFWVIGPATAGHGRGGCSYVELVATSAQMQRPLWFVSHAWLEPVCNFVACLKRHASLRQLSEQTAYWVCAYANNQHQLEAEICHNPRKTSFYRAIKMCAGVLLVLDNNATPFTRIWCCFEESIAIEERNKGSPLLLDVAATEQGRAHVITDGLVGEEQKMMPLLGFLAKSRREAEFPTEILLKGLDVDIASAMASKEADKKKILNSIALPRARTNTLLQEAQTTHESYDAVGRALAGHFALANLFCSVAKGLNTSRPTTYTRLLTALQNDAQRRTVQLSLTGCCKFNWLELRRFLAHLPAHLQILRLDLGFTAVRHVEFPQLLELHELSLRITKTPLRQVKLLRSSMPKLRCLQLLLSNLPDLEELQLEVARASCRQSLKELVLHVHRCPKLTKVAKQTLHDSVKTTWAWHRTDRWISIEETHQQDVFTSSAVDQVTFGPASCPEMSEEKDMPFPCSQRNCRELHQNLHGYCDKHRLLRFWRMASNGIIRTCVWLELIFLLSVQAAAEIQSRMLLLIILLSLLPATCIFLEESTGMSATFICITLLVVSVGSCFYTAKRLDGMQQRIFRLALATEASYFEVLQASEERSQPLISVSSILGSTSNGSLQDLPQNDLDLTTNFTGARSSMSRFQHSVCDPLSSLGSEVVAKIKPPAEADERGGDVDILFCEVVCDSLQRVQDGWHMLKEMHDVQIVTARDFFAIASSRKCCQVVVSVEGYLATVFFLEKSLSFQVAQKGVSEVANSLGLLDQTKAASWELSRVQEGLSQTPRSVLLATAVLRFVACGFSFGFALFIESKVCDGSFLSYYTLPLGFGLRFCSLWHAAMSLPWVTCGVILLWELQCCCCCLRCCWRRRRFRVRPRPTQVFYRAFFGVQGKYYAFKVAALQCITVLIQTFAKASVFHDIIETLGAVALRGHIAVYAFLALLFCNIAFPAFMFCFPNCVFSRVGAAMMDAALDMGYLITSLALYMDLARFEVIFLQNFWIYMSMYVCVAHVLCLCRSLETADWVALFQVPAAPPIWGVWKRVLFSIAYACGLFAVVAMLLGDSVLAILLEGGLCPPCECFTVSPGSISLERCIFWDRAATGSDPTIDAIDLSDRQLTALAPGAFWFRNIKREMKHYLRADTINLDRNRLTTVPAGAFEGVKVKRLLLQNNKLTHLNAGSFRGLSFWCCWGRHSRYMSSELDLSHNKLRTLPPKVFDFGENYSSGRHVRSDLHVLNLAHNEISSLPADAFAGHSELGTVEHHFAAMLERKFLQHRVRSHGRILGSLQILNLSRNALEELPPSLFHEFKPYLWHARRRTLWHARRRNLRDLRVIDLSYNKLSTLDSELFSIPSLRTLDLRGNPLTKATQLDLDPAGGCFRPGQNCVELWMD